MLCTDKGSMVQAQYCSEWTELWYGTLVRFLCHEMTQPELCELIIVSKYYYWFASNVCKPDTSGSRLKVPFAVTRHIYSFEFIFSLWPPISLLTCTCTPLWVFSVRVRASPHGIFGCFADEWSLMGFSCRFVVSDEILDFQIGSQRWTPFEIWGSFAAFRP